MALESPSLAFGIGLQGKPESTQKFQYLREQGKAKAKQAEADALDEERKNFQKRMAILNKSAVLPYQQKILTDKNTALVQKMFRMGSEPDYMSLYSDLHDLEQTAATFKKIADDVYSNKNSINNRSLQVLTTESDIDKVRKGLDPTSEFYMDDKDFLGRGKIDYEPTVTRIDKMFRDQTYFSPEAKEKDVKIGDKNYRIYGVTDAALYNMDAMFKSSNFLWGAKHDYAETLREKGIEPDVNSPEFIAGTQNYIGETLANASAARQKFFNTDLKKTNFNFYNTTNVGNGESTTDPTQRAGDIVIDITANDINGNPIITGYTLRDAVQTGDLKATAIIPNNAIDLLTGQKFESIGSVEYTANSTGVGAFAKRDLYFPRIDYSDGTVFPGKKITKGEIIPDFLLEAFPNEISRDRLEYKAITFAETKDRDKIAFESKLPTQDMYLSATEKNKPLIKQLIDLGERVKYYNSRLPAAPTNTKEVKIKKQKNAAGAGVKPQR
jgi:hypothetical protein